MAVEASNPQEVHEALGRLADLLSFSERFSEDPYAALAAHDLHAIPNEVVGVLASMSPEELRLLLQIYRKLSDVVVGNQATIFF